MSPQDIELFVALARARAGLKIDPAKTYLLESRLGPLARRENFPGIPEMAAARSSHGVAASLLDLLAAYTPYPMMPTAISTTTPATRIGAQLRPPATLTGVTGLRPLPPPLPLPAGPFLAGADFAPDFLAGPEEEAGGLPWPEVLETFTLDGTRSGPGVLILIVPRQFIQLKEGATAGAAPRAAKRESLPG